MLPLFLQVLGLAPLNTSSVVQASQSQAASVNSCLNSICYLSQAAVSMLNVSALRVPNVVPKLTVPVRSKYSIFVIVAGFLLLPTNILSPTSRSMVILFSVLIVQLPIHRYLVRINIICKAKRTYSLED